MPWPSDGEASDREPADGVDQTVDAVRRGREGGERAQMVLRLLEWRCVPVSDAVRERVDACTELDRLEVWAQRAMHVTDATDLFVEE
ncbi:hypothetical protein [Streptomyces sasae]|uniref:hypothetical protein n=1 Tax=Streptomyces sasae TaxID=1266772 RepID=UPI00293144C0|nr:hypothetical protein [Streptomyces sasae]